MRTIGILSQKGGSGKTTLAIHLAVAATQAGQNVIIADLDEQASATLWHRSREDKMPHVEPTHNAALPKMISVAAEEGMDFLIVDTAPQSDKAARGAAEASDVILITCRPTIMDLRAIQNTLQLIQLADLKENSEVWVVLTQIDSFGTLHEEARQLLIDMGAKVLPMTMGRRVGYHHGLIDGRTALEFDPRGKAANESRALFDAVRACGHAGLRAATL